MRFARLLATAARLVAVQPALSDGKLEL